MAEVSRWTIVRKAMAAHAAKNLGSRIKESFSASSLKFAKRQIKNYPTLVTYYDSWIPHTNFPEGWPAIRGRGTATFGCLVYDEAVDDDADDSRAYSIAQDLEFLFVGWALPLFPGEPTARFFDGGSNTEDIFGGEVVVRVLFHADVTKTFRSPLATST